MAVKIDNPIETLVGAGVLAVAIGFAVYASTPDDRPTATGSYEVFGLFSNASGVKVGTDVRVAGVKVGRVSEIGLDAESKKAKITLSVSEGVELSDETIAVVDSEGLLGGTYVALDPIPGFATLEAGDQIIHTQGAISLVKTISQFAGGGGDSE